MTEKHRPTLSGKAIATNSILTTPAEGFKGDSSLLNLSPLRAIHRYCVDCSGGSVYEVSKCPKDGKNSSLCPLFRFRFGHNPARSGIGNHNAIGFGSTNELSVESDDSSAVGGMQIPSEDSDGPSKEGRT